MKLFDLVIQVQGHSDLILIYSNLPCPNTFIYIKRINALVKVLPWKKAYDKKKITYLTMVLRQKYSVPNMVVSTDRQCIQPVYNLNLAVGV